MPTAAPKPCLQPGCGVLVRDGTSRCENHKVVRGSFADRARGSRQSRGYGAEWDRLRARILARDGGLCQPSLRQGLVVAATAVDHIVPKHRGGTDDDANLQAISAAPHAAKTAAERNGGTWDEAEWFARARVGGVQMSAGPMLRTDPLVKFSRAGVSGGGGISAAMGAKT